MSESERISANKMKIVITMASLYSYLIGSASLTMKFTNLLTKINTILQQQQQQQQYNQQKSLVDIDITI